MVSKYYMEILWKMVHLHDIYYLLLFREKCAVDYVHFLVSYKLTKITVYSRTHLVCI